MGQTPFRNNMDDQFFAEARNRIESGTNPQPTQQAPVAPSIAPDPGVPTGNQPAPMSDAGSGGMKPPTRTAVSGGPMPDDMRQELFSLPDREGNTFMSKPEGPKSQIAAYGGRAKRKVEKGLNDFRTKPQYKTGRRALYGGGGLAALATVLNLTNEDEQEAV